jgi:hypothetical protein
LLLLKALQQCCELFGCKVDKLSFLSFLMILSRVSPKRRTKSVKVEESLDVANAEL